MEKVTIGEAGVCWRCLVTFQKGLVGKVDAAYGFVHSACPANRLPHDPIPSWAQGKNYGPADLEKVIAEIDGMRAASTAYASKPLVDVLKLYDDYLW